MDKRRISLYLVIGFLLGSAGIVVATHLAGTGPVSGGVTYTAPDGMAVNLTGSTDVQMENMFPDNQTVALDTEAGNITFASSDPADAQIHKDNITGAWTTVTNIWVTGADVTIDPEDKTKVTVGKDIEKIKFRDASLSDGNVDFVYAGADGTTSKVILYSVPANTQIAAVDSQSGDVLDVATSDSNGNVTFSNLDNSEHNVELLDKDDATSPSLSNADPQGEVSDTPDQLKVDVSDGDFPNDNVSVRISLDGTEIHQEYITSNQTVSTSNFSNELDLGDHTWTVNTTDAYDLHQNETYQFSLPTNITFRNETNASQIVTGENATATFYSADGTVVIQRSDDDDDGNISLRGLPNTEFVVVVESENYYDRRVYIGSIFNQQNIYLLNSTAYPNAIDTTFIYEDRTGNFPQEETTLRVQRAVDPDGDGNHTWQTVAGDYWGAAGEFPFTGEYQTRYRLVAENTETGRQRILGTHIPSEDGVKNIVVGQIQWPADEGTGRYFDGEITTNESGGEIIRAYYVDPTEGSSDVQIKVWERGNESNVIHDQTYSNGPYGRLAVDIPLTENQSEKTWIVSYSATHSTDGQISGQTIIGGSPFNLPIDPWLLGTLGYILLTFITTLYGPRTAIIGSWVLLFAVGGIMILQLFHVPIASIVVMFGIAAGGTFYRGAMP